MEVRHAQGADRRRFDAVAERRRARRGDLADPAGAAADAGAARERHGAGQRHPDVLRGLRRGRAGAADPRRPRQRRRLGLPGAGARREPQGDRRRQPRPRPQHALRQALRLRADGRRLPGPARPPGDRQGGAGRLERRRHHRARHRDPPSRAPEPAVRLRRQLYGRRRQGERRGRPDLQRRHRARRRGLRPPVADAPASSTPSSRRSPRCGRPSRTTPRTSCARSPCRR